jgi:hypothetical protein
MLKYLIGRSGPMGISAHVPLRASFLRVSKRGNATQSPPPQAVSEAVAAVNPPPEPADSGLLAVGEEGRMWVSAGRGSEFSRSPAEHF